MLIGVPGHRFRGARLGGKASCIIPLIAEVSFCPYPPIPSNVPHSLEKNAMHQAQVIGYRIPFLSALNCTEWHVSA